MERKNIYRILFLIFMSYNIWSFINYGFEGLRLIPLDYSTEGFVFRLLEFILVLVSNLINYSLHLLLPLLFFYKGWIKK